MSQGPWWKYWREAFTFRWNLLFLGGATAAAVLSGRPDVGLPLIGAAELLYLTGLATLPRFQRAIDAKDAKSPRAIAASSQDSQQRFLLALRGLGEERRNRFLRLRGRCLEMQRIASAVRGEQRDPAGLASTQGLDRLLWAFLRLLASEQALEQFLAAANVPQLRDQLTRLKAREEEAASRADERIVRSVRDSIATTELRLDNQQKAMSNFEFVRVELERIEQKIHALTEMSVSHHDPDLLSTQVDAVAADMSQTEATLRELHAITGFSSDEGAPSILGSAMMAEIEGPAGKRR